MNFKSQEGACLNFSKISELKISPRPDPRKKNKNTKYGPFHSNYALFNKTCFFLSVKEEEKHCIWPSQYKYDSSDVYLRGSLAVNMFSNSKISEFGLKGGGTDFF